MDYTQSPDHVVDVATGARRHEDNQALPTIVTDDDMNSLIWTILEVIKAAQLPGVAFNPAVPATYKDMLKAILRIASRNVTVVNAAISPFLLTPDHCGLVLVNAQAGPVVLTLPAASVLAPLSLHYSVVKIDGTTNSCTVKKSDVVNNADLIDNFASVVLNEQNQSRSIRSDAASKWLTLSRSDNPQAVLNKLYPSASGGTDTRGVDVQFDPKKGSLRVGGSDPLPTNDERGFWGALSSKNAWGAAANIGLYSVAFNRNGASVGTYSSTYGHDCIAMGTASLAGGAGSATGNELDPYNLLNPFQGYCSFSWGKNIITRGPKSFGFGEEGESNSRSSGTFGYANKTGAGLALHSNSTGGAGVASDGIGAIAKGYACEAYGDGAQAAGRFVRSYNGSQTMGSGPNSSSPLKNTTPDSVGFGSKVLRPTFTCLPGDGSAGDKGKSASRSAYYSLIDINTALDVLGSSFGAELSNGANGGYAKIFMGILRAGTLTPAMEIDAVTMTPKFFGDAINHGLPRTVASAVAAGNRGEICYDADYIYVCHQDNKWKRTAISVW